MIKDLVEENRYETNQTVVAAYFVYMGLELDDVVWENGVCVFFFENTKELQQELRKFVSSEARVEPQAFNNTFVQVRNRMFEAKGGKPR